MAIMKGSFCLLSILAVSSPSSIVADDSPVSPSQQLTAPPTLAPQAAGMTKVSYSITQTTVNVTYQSLLSSQYLVSFESVYSSTMKDMLVERLIYPSTISSLASSASLGCTNVTIITNLDIILEYSSYSSVSELTIAVENALRITSETHTFLSKLKTYSSLCGYVLFVTSVEIPSRVTCNEISSNDVNSDGPTSKLSVIMIITIAASVLILIMCLIISSFEFKRWIKTRRLRSIVTKASHQYFIVDPYERFAPKESSKRASRLQQVKSAFILPNSTDINKRISTVNEDRFDQMNPIQRKPINEVKSNISNITNKNDKNSNNSTTLTAENRKGVDDYFGKVAAPVDVSCLEYVVADAKKGPTRPNTKPTHQLTTYKL